MSLFFTLFPNLNKPEEIINILYYSFVVSTTNRFL